MDIKKLIILLAIIPFLLGGTNTTNYNLYKPVINETGWGTVKNSDWDVIDLMLFTVSTDTDTNTTAIALNTTHRSSDGSDHSKVTDNETDITGLSSDVGVDRETWEGLSEDVGTIYPYITGLSEDVGIDRTIQNGLSEDVGVDRITWESHVSDNSPTFQDLTISTILTIPVSADPDVNEVGQIAYDSNDYVLRASADVGQIALGMRIRTIQATILEPDQVDASTTYIFSNETDLVFNIDEIKAWSDTDDVDFTLEEVTFDGTTSADIEAITIATDGTNIFYTTVASGDIDNTTIANNSLIGLSFDTSDTPNYIKISLRGWYDANKN